MGRPVEVASRVQRLKATVWLAEDFPLSLQEQIMPIIDLMVCVGFVYTVCIHVLVCCVVLCVRVSLFGCRHSITHILLSSRTSLHFRCRLVFPSSSVRHCLTPLSLHIIHTTFI